MSRPRRSRALLLLIGAVAFATPAAPFTIQSPLAVVGDDAAATAAVTEALSQRFRNLRRLPSLAAAQEAARAQQGPELALVVSTTQQPQQVTAYGVGMTACDVSLTIEVLDLPEARSLFSHRGAKRAPGCPEALQATVADLADNLLVSLESYRRAGRQSGEHEVTAELQPAGTKAENDELAGKLKSVVGIRSVRLLPDGRLSLTVYRELRELAREIDALPDLTVSRIGDDSLTLLAGPQAAAAPGATAPPSTQPERALPATRDAGRDAGTERQASARAVGGLVATAPVGPSTVARTPTAFHDKWALVVGISRFADPTVPTLGYARKDAEAFAATLLEPTVGRFQSDRVVTLLDDRATLRNFKSQLELLARVVEPDDLFVVFLSTHAAPGEVDMAGDPYFVAYDTEKADLYATGLAMRELTDALLNRIRARNVVAFLDACYTGQVLARSQLALAGSKSMVFEPSPGAPAPVSWSREWATLAKAAPKPLALPPAEPTAPRRSEPAAGGKSLVLMTSSDGTEPSWESDTLGHGVFTYYLMEGLRDSQGLASVEELFDRLRDRVARQVAAEKQRNQQPRLFFSDQPSVAIGAPAVPARGGSSP